MQPDRLIHSQQLVKSIPVASANTQPEVDLRERSNSCSHGRTIVNSTAPIRMLDLQINLLSRTPPKSHGLGPNAGVILDAAGSLYGTTLTGGAFNSGTIFKIAP